MMQLPVPGPRPLAMVDSVSGHVWLGEWIAWDIWLVVLSMWLIFEVGVYGGCLVEVHLGHLS